MGGGSATPSHAEVCTLAPTREKLHLNSQAGSGVIELLEFNMRIVPGNLQFIERQTRDDGVQGLNCFINRRCFLRRYNENNRYAYVGPVCYVKGVRRGGGTRAGP